MAILYRGSERVADLKYHLGGAKEHTVYEAELMGIMLGAELLKIEDKITKGMISLDNMAAIAATGFTHSMSGHYLVNMVHAGMAEVKKRHKIWGKGLTVRWVPGHKGVVDNEAADEEAKKVARGETSPAGQLPKSLKGRLQQSTSALKWLYGEWIKAEHADNFQKSM